MRRRKKFTHKPKVLDPESRRATRAEHSSPIYPWPFIKYIMLLISSRIYILHSCVDGWRRNHGTVNSDSDLIEDSSSRLLFWRYLYRRNGARRTILWAMDLSQINYLQQQKIMVDHSWSSTFWICKMCWYQLDDVSTSFPWSSFIVLRNLFNHIS